MANNRDNQLWLQLWRNDEIDFHQKSVNQLLMQFWPKLECNKTSRVFVPLCGKSLDMTWRAKQGYQVISVELSPVAVKAFFRDNQLNPVKQKREKIIQWRAGNIEILCGDYFSLKKKDLGQIDIVYDRTSLTALPEDIRKLYVIHLSQIVSTTTDVFLLTTEDAEEGETLKQALGVGKEIKTLFAEKFEIDLAHVESVFEPNTASYDQTPIRTEYKLYRLFSRTRVCVPGSIA